MSTTLGFIIRDALETDIEACLKLDHSYETETVWQMNFQQEIGQWYIAFKTERLPRIMETTYPADAHRLRLSLPADQGFLVAVRRDEPELLGYLTMRTDPVHHLVLLQDVVVSRPYRRNHIGKRLLNVAWQWAHEHQFSRMIAELQTKNYPGITFCQNAGFAFCGFNDRYFPNQDIAVFFSVSIR